MAADRYRFVRDPASPIGGVSDGGAGDDAHTAISIWTYGAQHREIKVQVKEVDYLIADLAWLDGDATAASQLDAACERRGVQYTVVS